VRVDVDVGCVIVLQMSSEHDEIEHRAEYVAWRKVIFHPKNSSFAFVRNQKFLSIAAELSL
jgi:hypothetical protein